MDMWGLSGGPLRVVCPAFGCPDSPFPALCRAPSPLSPPGSPLNIKGMSGVSQAASFELGYSAGMLGDSSFQSGKGFVVCFFDAVGWPWQPPDVYLPLLCHTRVTRGKGLNQDVCCFVIQTPVEI
eukprot:1147975-Pelagomonas_calceolata.AAC.1